jgi:DNA-binding Lrp family transcriptional regulator
MSVWNIKEEQIEPAARKIVAFPQVGHCYQRSRFPGWPYNVYAMIHETSSENINKVADEISQQIQCSDYTILFTDREFKKTSMKYFVNEIPEETYEYNE